MLTHTCACMHTYIHAYIHYYYTYIHTYKYIHTLHAYIHKHTYTYIHIYIYIHTYIHTYIHEYIHTLNNAKHGSLECVAHLLVDGQMMSMTGVYMSVMKNAREIFITEMPPNTTARVNNARHFSKYGLIPA